MMIQRVLKQVYILSTEFTSNEWQKVKIKANPKKDQTSDFFPEDNNDTNY